MRHDRLDEPHAVSSIGARQRDEVLHRGVRDQPAVVYVLLHGLGQRAHQTHAARDPAHAAIEAPGQRVERQAVIVMQRAEQPALLERAVGGTQELPKDQRLSLRHLPHDGGDGVPVQPAETPDAFVAVDDDVGRPADHHHDRHLLTGIGQGRQEAAFARRLPKAQPLVPQLELMKFQVHRPSVRRRLLWHRADRVLRRARGSWTPRPLASTTSRAYWSCAAHGGSRPASPVESTTWTALWSCAAPSKTRPRWPRKSVPTTPNASCARSHGSSDRGGGSAKGRTTASGSSAFRRRRWMRWAMK